MKLREDLSNLWVAEGARRLALAHLDDGSVARDRLTLVRTRRRCTITGSRCGGCGLSPRLSPAGAVEPERADPPAFPFGD